MYTAFLRAIRGGVVVVAVTMSPAWTADDDPNAAIADAINRFETTVERSFAASDGGFDRYRQGRTREVTRTLTALLKQHDDPSVRQFIGYHLLQLDPRSRSAVALFAEQVVPFTAEQAGLHPAAIGQIPAAPTSALALMALDWHHHQRDAVVAAANTVLRSYSRQKRRAALKLQEQLETIGRQYPSLVAPHQAFYFPGRRPRGVIWINPIDRYLLRYGLITNDVTQQPATLPLMVPTFQLEAALINGQSAELLVAGNGNRQLSCRCDAQAVVILVDGEEVLRHPLTQPATTLVLGVHQRVLLLSIDGAPVASGTMSKSLAAVSVRQGQGSATSVARLRFLGDEPLLALADDAATESSSPETTATLDEATLAIRFTYQAELVAMSEVLTALSGLTGVTFDLADTAEAFGEVPVDLVAQNMTVAQLLDWFAHYLELDYRVGDAGVSLTWGE